MDFIIPGCRESSICNSNFGVKNPVEGKRGKDVEGERGKDVERERGKDLEGERGGERE